MYKRVKCKKCSSEYEIRSFKAPMLTLDKRKSNVICQCDLETLSIVLKTSTAYNIDLTIFEDITTEMAKVLYE